MGGSTVLTFLYSSGFHTDFWLGGGNLLVHQQSTRVFIIIADFSIIIKFS